MKSCAKLAKYFKVNRNSKLENSAPTFLIFGHLNLFRISIFEFRISSLSGLGGKIMNSDLLFHRAVSGESSAISPEANAREFLVVCPKCKTMETLLFIDGHLLMNRKFSEHDDGGVYHDCGASEPCRFFRNGRSILLHKSPVAV
jgi:hypothetical protein